MPNVENQVVAPPVVKLIVKNNFADAVATVLAETHRHVVDSETGDTHTTFMSHHIVLERDLFEALNGSMSDLQWRMLCANREGDVQEFTGKRLEIGAPLPSEEPEPAPTPVNTSGIVQINSRIPSDLKRDMLDQCTLLGLTQAEYIQQAIQLMVDTVREGV
jgi:hypothetical protein